jgi:hypothetical protein
MIGYTFDQGCEFPPRKKRDNATVFVTTSPVEKFDSSQVVLTGRDLGD